RRCCAPRSRRATPARWWRCAASRRRRGRGVQVVAARFREDLCLAAGADIEARGAPVTLAGP
ncbi:hypothetical protein, partial [Bordetella pertussis]|uniref:hypothetical protein n=1 Tax=Bordetella pertussis TaxID=520 RepID=UPI001C92DBF1